MRNHLQPNPRTYISSRGYSFSKGHTGKRIAVSIFVFRWRLDDLWVNWWVNFLSLYVNIWNANFSYTGTFNPSIYPFWAKILLKLMCTFLGEIVFRDYCAIFMYVFFFFKSLQKFFHRRSPHWNWKWKWLKAIPWRNEKNVLLFMEYTFLLLRSLHTLVLSKNWTDILSFQEALIWSRTTGGLILRFFSLV